MLLNSSFIVGLHHEWIKKIFTQKTPVKPGFLPFIQAKRALFWWRIAFWRSRVTDLWRRCGLLCRKSADRSWDKRASQERGSKCSPALVLVNLKCGLPERWKAASAAAAENVYRGKLSRKKTDKAFFRNTGSKVKSIDKCSKFIVK